MYEINMYETKISIRKHILVLIYKCIYYIYILYISISISIYLFISLSLSLSLSIYIYIYIYIEVNYAINKITKKLSDKTCLHKQKMITYAMDTYPLKQ